MRAVLAPLILMAAMPTVAAVPEDVYRSATNDYSPYRESAVADWRAANEAVGPMQGHAGHAGSQAFPAPGAERDGKGQAAQRETGGHPHHMGEKP